MSEQLISYQDACDAVRIAMGKVPGFVIGDREFFESVLDWSERQGLREAVSAEGSNWAWVEIMGDRRNNARPVIVSSLIEAGIVSLAMALERRAVRGDAVP